MRSSPPDHLVPRPPRAVLGDDPAEPPHLRPERVRPPHRPFVERRHVPDVVGAAACCARTWARNRVIFASATRVRRGPDRRRRRSVSHPPDHAAQTSRRPHRQASRDTDPCLGSVSLRWLSNSSRRVSECRHASDRALTRRRIELLVLRVEPATCGTPDPRCSMACFATLSGRKLSIITASSSVYFAPMLASARPGCGPCGMPSGWCVMLPNSMPFRLMNSLDA